MWKLRCGFLMLLETIINEAEVHLNLFQYGLFRLIMLEIDLLLRDLQLILLAGYLLWMMIPGALIELARDAILKALRGFNDLGERLIVLELRCRGGGENDRKTGLSWCKIITCYIRLREHLLWFMGDKVFIYKERLDFRGT